MIDLWIKFLRFATLRNFLLKKSRRRRDLYVTQKKKYFKKKKASKKLEEEKKFQTWKICALLHYQMYKTFIILPSHHSYHTYMYERESSLTLILQCTCVSCPRTKKKVFLFFLLARKRRKKLQDFWHQKNISSYWKK